MPLDVVSAATLQALIEAKTARLAVIGLGYVGLPVACEFARAGFNVTGVELRQERVEQINAGISPIEGDEPGLDSLLREAIRNGRLRATAAYPALGEVDVILVCVETPVDAFNTPRYEALRAVLRSLGPVLKRGALVVIESTIAPTTMQTVVCPLLEESTGGKVNVDFFLGNCPERVMPGRLLANLRNMSRVIGGMSPETAQAMLALYRNIVNGELDAVDCITAELVKTVENTYRDVQIAFANEVAMICEAVGSDVWRVRELVNKLPSRQMHLPGAGVGGHCIPKDPWLLAYGVKEQGVALRVIPASREVNSGMPRHIAALISTALANVGKDLAHSRILVMGYAYLENSDDTRNSPSQALVEILSVYGAQTVIHDPFVPGYGSDLFATARGCDAAVVMVRHQAYENLDLAELALAMRDGLEFSPVLVDGRRVYSAETAGQAGLLYRCIGVGGQTA
jgi:UDP-N-acetyl-D-mannosaminuronic acid dehydrogenase